MAQEDSQSVGLGSGAEAVPRLLWPLVLWVVLLFPLGLIWEPGDGGVGVRAMLRGRQRRDCSTTDARNRIKFFTVLGQFANTCFVRAVSHSQASAARECN